MKLVVTSKDILSQLTSVIEQISEDDFRKVIPILNNSTIGQHIRHTLEFFICLVNHSGGCVNYDQRGHDKLIESDRELALETIKSIMRYLDDCKTDKALKLEVNYELDNNELVSIHTNLYRELAYNIEHAIHHMAIIKIGLKQLGDYINIPDHFGVAVSTVKYQNQNIEG